ncbi:MAG: hypothetical protein RMH93_03845 [Aquificaceae bacterium]|nr:hypothetical protein [Aquificaceae bacterium]MCS7195819.1 hypothetical protein [Aquificaceae bacterium]MDW8032661.1 hypothetical protein [Aquificaceae bacterium]MDW8293757.1 hypothetical protein [Aquificaceae bacterium]
MEDLKRLLLECQLYLQQGDWDRLVERLSSVSSEDIEKLDLKTAQECLAILEHLIREGEEHRNRIATTLVNLKKFKESYGG